MVLAGICSLRGQIVPIWNSFWMIQAPHARYRTGNGSWRSRNNVTVSPSLVTLSSILVNPSGLTAFRSYLAREFNVECLVSCVIIML
jgi:hypothetical protein